MTIFSSRNYQPLIHCISNSLSSHYVANAIHAVQGKPIMAEDMRELEDISQKSDALVINLGQITEAREIVMEQAMSLAYHQKKIRLLDVVGVGASQVRLDFAKALLSYEPTLVKGNQSEIRALLGLKNNARGVDGSQKDGTKDSLTELVDALQAFSLQHPQTIFLATGPIDVIVNAEQSMLLANGVEMLDCFSGSGDALSGLLAVSLVTVGDAFEAIYQGLSYFNCTAQSLSVLGPTSFSLSLLDSLSSFYKIHDWMKMIKEVTLDDL